MHFKWLPPNSMKFSTHWTTHFRNQKGDQSWSGIWQFSKIAAIPMSYILSIGEINWEDRSTVHFHRQTTDTQNERHITTNTGWIFAVKLHFQCNQQRNVYLAKPHYWLSFSRKYSIISNTFSRWSIWRRRSLSWCVCELAIPHLAKQFSVVMSWEWILN